MITIKKIITTLGLFGLSNFVLANQDFVVNNGDSVDAVISDNDVSRISIDGVKITSVKLANNQLKIDTDDENGQIFVYPTKNNVKTVKTTKIGNISATTVEGSLINMFVIAEDGATYSLRLRLQSIPSESIRLKPRQIAGSKANNNTSTDFVNQLVTISEDMYLDKTDNGYEVADINMEIPLWKEVSFVLYRTYSSGNGLKGSSFILKNISNQPITLVENQFWKPKTISVAIEKPVLQPNELTKVFVVEDASDEQ